MMLGRNPALFEASRRVSAGGMLAPFMLLAVLLAGAGFAVAQNSSPSGVYQYPRPGWANDPTQPAPGSEGGDPGARIARQKRLGLINAERQKSLVADTQKLVKLAAELNTEINSAHQAELTPAQLRKVAEIEKLAHSVRDKMSSPVTGISSGFDIPSVIPLSVQ